MSFIRIFLPLYPFLENNIVKFKMNETVIENIKEK